jgi:hypothetical protein
MSSSTTGPRLLIDEAEVHLGHAWMHDQDYPYPGGHRYRLWLPGELAEPWLSGRRPTLSGLYSLLSFSGLQQAVRETKPWLYVLNTVEAVEPMPAGVELRGECSPFVTG